MLSAVAWDFCCEKNYYHPIEGFAEDDCIDIEFDSEGYQDQIGADGHVVRYKSCDQRATITFCEYVQMRAAKIK